jgi:3-hydroxybutyryl-CoA dehydrogenase
MMTIDIQTPFVLGVVGTGLMGRGIAQIAAQGGIQVILHDSRENAALEAKDAIISIFESLAAKGKMTTDAVVESVARLSVASSLTDLAECSVVVEAIVEKLDAKRELFQRS